MHIYLDTVLVFFACGIAARIGWALGNKALYLYNCTVGILPYSVSKYLVLM